LGVFLGLSAGSAHAQILQSYLPDLTLGTDSVLSRPRPEYLTPGVRVGSFVLHPSAQESVGYNSNVLGQAGSAGSPQIETSGTLEAASDWSRDSVAMFVNVDNVQTPNARQLDYTDVTAALAGTLDIGRDQLRGAYTYLLENQAPSAIGGIGLQQNLPFVTNDARASYVAQFARVAIIPAIDVDGIRYGSSVTNGVSQSYGYLDRNVYTPSVTTRYELAPQRDVLFVLRGASAQYLSAQPGSPRRNYVDLEALTGLDFSATGVTRFGVLLGYETRSYQSAQIQGASSPVIEGTVIWTPTRLTTFTGLVTHRIEDAVEDNIYNYTFTEIRGVVDHELRRDVLLQGYVDIQRANYGQNGGIQNVYGVGGSVAWLLNRNLQLRASAALSDSVAPSPSNYTRDVFLLQLRFGL
jgi:hypothetical protein